MTTWTLFIGAGLLGAGLMFRAGAPVVPVILGVALAAFITWITRRTTRPHP